MTRPRAPKGNRRGGSDAQVPFFERWIWVWSTLLAVASVPIAVYTPFSFYKTICGMIAIEFMLLAWVRKRRLERFMREHASRDVEEA